MMTACCSLFFLSCRRLDSWVVPACGDGALSYMATAVITWCLYACLLVRVWRVGAVFEEEEDPATRSYFSEIVASISDAKFSRDGKYIFSRDYLTVKVGPGCFTNSVLVCLCLPSRVGVPAWQRWWLSSQYYLQSVAHGFLELGIVALCVRTRLCVMWICVSMRCVCVRG